MKNFFLFIVLFSVLSCEEKIEKPTKFLEKGEMTNLLFELSLLTSARSLYTKDSVFVSALPEQILIKYNLDSLSFVELNNYYINQPLIYAEIYDSINKRFDRKIKEFEALPEDPRDTIGKNQINLRTLKSILK